LALSYNYVIRDLIYYIKYEENETNEGMWKGVRLIATFVGLMVVTTVLRNQYIITGFQFSFKLRRTLVATLFDKAVKLSMKSMTETNSGKLISLVSADLFTVERGLGFFPITIASPFLNCLGVYAISTMIDFKYTLIVIGYWFVTMVLQFLFSKKSKTLRAQESRLNDERLKLVNDLVVGVRTIKCYAWENYYI
jgi:ATP-binding cassette, subfamily C (CFTR/MRP), member 1